MVFRHGMQETRIPRSGQRFLCGPWAGLAVAERVRPEGVPEIRLGTRIRPGGGRMFAMKFPTDDRTLAEHLESANLPRALALEAYRDGGVCAAARLEQVGTMRTLCASTPNSKRGSGGIRACAATATTALAA